MYKYFIIILPALLTVVPSAPEELSVEMRVGAPALEVPMEDYRSCLTDSIVETALTYLGTSYYYGGYSSSGIDCSGLMHKAFTVANYELPRSSSSMSELGQAVDIDSVQKGDLIFFTGRNNSSQNVGHVALVTANDSMGVQMVHATKRGVVHDVLNEQEYYLDRILFAKRIDVIAY